MGYQHIFVVKKCSKHREKSSAPLKDDFIPFETDTCLEVGFLGLTESCFDYFEELPSFPHWLYQMGVSPYAHLGPLP